MKFIKKKREQFRKT